MHEAGSIFPGQRPDEKIIIFTRRHWVVLFNSLMATLALVGAYFVALFVVIRFAGLSWEGVVGDILTAVTGIAMLISWLYLYIKFVDYYLDVWILTTERIVEIKQRSLFNRQVAELDLSTVQDVSSKVRGIFGTFLNYGTIFVQTAGTTELFQFNKLPRPYDAEKKILDIQAGLEERTKQEIGAAISQGTPLTDKQQQAMRRDIPDLE